MINETYIDEIKSLKSQLAAARVPDEVAPIARRGFRLASAFLDSVAVLRYRGETESEIYAHPAVELEARRLELWRANHVDKVLGSRPIVPSPA